MGISWALYGVLLYLSLFLILFPSLVIAQPPSYLIANPSSSWMSHSGPDYLQFEDKSAVRIILFSGSSNSNPGFACGFFCNQTCDDYLFAIFIVSYDMDGLIGHGRVAPQVVWSANQKNPVYPKATLELTSERGLVLIDADGTTAWSTNTNNKSVAGLNLTDMGNLMLLDENNATIWQSFDHPTDSLLIGQKLLVGQKLSSSPSATYKVQGAIFSVSPTSYGLAAFMESNASQQYYSHYSNNITYIQFLNGSLAFFTDLGESETPFEIPIAYTFQYMRIGPDGHLRVYEWSQRGFQWKEVADLLTTDLGYCGYPTVCGNYGICTNDQCSCPKTKNRTDYFKQVNDMLPDHGCSLITPLSCEASQNWSILELENVTYFRSVGGRDSQEMDFETCKHACLKNCSCKAAIFGKIWRSYTLDSSGNIISGNFSEFCSLQSEIFSLIADTTKTITTSRSTVYIKIKPLSSGGRRTISRLVSSQYGVVFMSELVAPPV
ncbi:hypothetical protein CMV_016980 [Castanea mollissima]|uniref:Bulb-type lectin domain-containing protein n=1 Tax=Castanea mollissima TaxID=60419 RepID=A0A8J4QYP8_9ROSI|nr:hypothetical protein CMV_016980 [Castanea mollissima]